MTAAMGISAMHSAKHRIAIRSEPMQKPPTRYGLAAYLRAGNGTRTRDPNLGKVVLYQLSYSRIFLPN